MGILEGIVIATIVIAGAYVGYHAWQESLNAPEAEAHSIDFEFKYYNSQILSAESYSQVFMPIRFY